ncbi:MAG TPA: hypothetical protein DHW61_06035 [Lachnoclostridium phytofermentans]|uniref:DUF4367 domain-containing protein n=2 Tax=Lachnoclostridium TaxID=1506553 RepID=A0A3D2X4S3_9FIRM|nr:hypothetical protein [Lachnoclostridium phytofermentans]
MIFMSDYKNALTKIYISKEMEERVMREVKTKVTKTKQQRTIGRRWLLLAVMVACVALSLGILVLPKLTKGTKEQVQIPNPIVETDDIKTLKESVSFPLKVPTVVPEGYEVIDTSVIGGTIAQITYSNGTNNITYRMAEGTDDISGEYNTYEKLREITVDGQNVLLKGNNDGYQVATWTDGTYTYSITSGSPLREKQIVQMIEGIQ